MAAKMRLGLEVVEGEFGRNVRALRAHLGLSDNELAAKLGVSGGAVRNWESGSSVPTEDHIAHLIRMAGGEIDVRWFLRGEGDAPAWEVQPRKRRSSPLVQPDGGLSVSYDRERLIIDVPANSYRLDVDAAGVHLIRIVS